MAAFGVPVVDFFDGNHHRHRHLIFAMCPFALLAAWRTFEGDLPEQPVRRTQWRDGLAGEGGIYNPFIRGNDLELPPGF